MKTNIVYLLATLFAVMLISCADESEQLFPATEEMAAVNDSVLINSMAFSDEIRGLRPSTSQQMDDDGVALPDRKGEKGRDHREWYDMLSNGRFKNFDTGSLLSPGELYAIDPDGYSPYIFFKFYFPEEMKINDEFLGMSAYVELRYKTQFGTSFERELVSAYPFHYDDTFTIPRDYLKEWNVLRCRLYNLYSGAVKDISYDISFPDLVIIKQLQ